jgi:integral membrane protein
MVYRVLAYLTGTGLVVLVLVAMPLKYVWDIPEPTMYVGQVHGFLYAAYAVVVLLYGFVTRWTLVRTGLVVLAGTVPLAGFYAERKVVAHEQHRERSLAAA